VLLLGYQEIATLSSTGPGDSAMKRYPGQYDDSGEVRFFLDSPQQDHLCRAGRALNISAMREAANRLNTVTGELTRREREVPWLFAALDGCWILAAENCGVGWFGSWSCGHSQGVGHHRLRWGRNFLQNRLRSFLWRERSSSRCVMLSSWH
jgi:hypothetical protein